jgi:hypothetical protein
VRDKTAFFIKSQEISESALCNSVLAVGSYKNSVLGTMSCVQTVDYNYHYTEVNTGNGARYFVTHTANLLIETKLAIEYLQELMSQTKNSLKINRLYVAGYSQDDGLAKRIPHIDFEIDYVHLDSNLKGNNERIISDFIRGQDKPFIDLSKLGLDS